MNYKSIIYISFFIFSINSFANDADNASRNYNPKYDNSLSQDQMNHTQLNSFTTIPSQGAITSASRNYNENFDLFKKIEDQQKRTQQQQSNTASTSNSALEQQQLAELQKIKDANTNAITAQNKTVTK